MTLEKLAQAKSLLDQIDSSSSKVAFWQEKLDGIIKHPASNSSSVGKYTPVSKRTQIKVLELCIDDEKEHIRNLEHSFSLI